MKRSPVCPLVLTPVSHTRASFRDILMSRPRAVSQQMLNDPRLELTYNGRGALLQACTKIARRGKTDILLPAYHCPSGISPAIHAGLKPVFYRIRRDLSIDFDDLNAKLGADTAAVLVIHYFGVATDLQSLQGLRERGVEIIEDWSHSFLQGTPPRLSGSSGDYRVYSFWKLVPTMVGGGLWQRGIDRQTNMRPKPQPPMHERMVRLKRMFEEALNRSGYTRAKALFNRFEAMRIARRPQESATVSSTDRKPSPGESHYPFDLTLANCRMPGLAKRILEGADLTGLMAQRRNNFDLYGRLLVNSHQLQIPYPVLPADTCPWVFPVLLQNRDNIDHIWRAHGVALHTFGIYLHSALFRNTDAATIADAKYLSEHLLCLAIHQDIRAEQIECSSATINHYLANAGATASHED